MTRVDSTGVDQLVAVLCEGDPDAALALLDRCLSEGLSPWRALDQIVAPAMHRIGELCERGVLSSADEHLATVTCERALAGLYPSLLVERPRSQETVLVAAVEGERHALAPRIIADVLEGQGYRVINLGADVSDEILGAAVRRYAPDVVALSLSVSSGTGALERSIAVARSVCPDVLFLLGGQGVGPAWAQAGFPVADGAEAAVELVGALLRDRPAMPRSLPAAPPPAVMPVAARELLDQLGLTA